MSNVVQTPGTGERQVRFVGDIARFTLRLTGDRPIPPGWQARLRTTLGRAERVRDEIIAAVETGRTPAGTPWHDVPMQPHGDHWSVEFPLAEVGWFLAKAYALDERGWQHWPDGRDFGLNIQPAWCRTANTIYCAWPRLFGAAQPGAAAGSLDEPIEPLDAAGYTVIPPSGRLRDLRQALPHIFETLGCRILHLLPVNPTPTTYARFGRFGSPYACGDLLAIDPALVEFDRRTTGLDQFRELAFATHAQGGRLFLDMVINHTGWGSTLQERHPEWFAREPNGEFKNPGAWDHKWEDLVELQHHHAGLRRHLADVFLEWCRRGVDGFRCDAGYQVPRPVWQYIIARVQQEFPESVFLLEGLGGSWEATETLLTEGGMQWAYSELFQNYDGLQVSGYLDHALRQSRRVGLMVHYSETHDNLRLAARGRRWSLLRNRLCALTSVSGGFGFTCGVEWLATEKIDVHGRPSLNWGASDNLVGELARLNRLLVTHPCFFDHARLTRLSRAGTPVLALLRESADGQDAVLVLANTDTERRQTLEMDSERLTDVARSLLEAIRTRTAVELLEQPLPGVAPSTNPLRVQLEPAAVHCVARHAAPIGLAGEAYRDRKALAALAVEVLAQHLPPEIIGAVSVDRLAELLDADPVGYLSAATYLDRSTAGEVVLAELNRHRSAFPRVVVWHPADRRRITPVPPGHWLLVKDASPFRASLSRVDARWPQRRRSVRLGDWQVACFPPSATPGEAVLELELYRGAEPRLTAALRDLAAAPFVEPEPASDPGAITLLTNGAGAMARLAVNLGAVQSKYDCALGANLHPRVPVDRHVLVKRVRVWANADGMLSALNAGNLSGFSPGPPAHWRFLASGGDGRFAEIELHAWMVSGENTTVLRFSRPDGPPPSGQDLPPEADVRLTVRLDLEDRNFHQETRRNGGADHHFTSHCQPLRRPAQAPIGFEFTPASDRQVRVWADVGQYHPQPEWCENIPHPLEASRGQAATGDAFSPGWFELPLPRGSTATLVLTTESAPPLAPSPWPLPSPPAPAGEERLVVKDRLTAAARDFVVRRDDAKTVIAGYPWFLDWGRDVLIAARGLITAGFSREVHQLLRIFGGFEQNGTLPNAIHGDDASNRDTSDAPLWYGVVCEEFAAAHPDGALWEMRVGQSGRTIADVLRSVAAHYLSGTPNGIRVDPESGLVWSPSHFTWMDTNYPAGTPREGYPVEIQALWIRLLRLLERLGVAPVGPSWKVRADQALESVQERFWLENRGWFADALRAPRGTPARAAQVDDALRSNCLFLISLGLVAGDRARRCVASAQQHLVVPGGLRSLAPLPVRLPLAIRRSDGRLLNDPAQPYWGRYEGDEDTHRKPAYHNGTAWVWALPSFCEALVRAWDCAPAAVNAARAYLGSVTPLLATGCAGQLPEILDGDAPHTQRGCDAQAWSVTEVLRVADLIETSAVRR